jgi:hypothetical protein
MRPGIILRSRDPLPAVFAVEFDYATTFGLLPASRELLLL